MKWYQLKKFKKKLRMGELSYWKVCNLLLEKCERRWLTVANVSHNLCGTFKGTWICCLVSGQVIRIGGNGDEYEIRGEPADHFSVWTVMTQKFIYVLWTVTKEMDLEDPADIVYIWQSPLPENL